MAWRRQIPGCVAPPSMWLDSGAVLVPFADRFGRPVVVIRARYLEPGKIPLDVLERGFCATLDAVIGHLLLQRRDGNALEKNLLDQYVCCIDSRGAGRRTFSFAAMKMMQRLATARY